MNMEQNVRTAIKDAYMELQPPQTLKTRLLEKLDAEGDRQLRKKSIFARKITGVTIVASLGFSALLVGASVSPVVHAAMSEIPGIGSIISMFGDRGEAHAKDHVQQYQMTANDHGITMTIREVLYDGVRLTIGYETDLQQPAELESDVSVQLMVDGAPLKISQMRMISEKSKPGETSRGLLTIYPNETPPDQMKLDLLVTRIGHTEGSWTYKLPVSVTTPTAKTYTPQLQETFGDVSISVTRLNFTSAVTELDLDIRQSTGGYKEMEFDVFDDKGNKIKRISYMIHDEKQETVKVKALYAAVDQVPAFVEIKPRFDESEEYMGTIRIPLTK